MATGTRGNAAGRPIPIHGASGFGVFLSHFPPSTSLKLQGCGSIDGARLVREGTLLRKHLGDHCMVWCNGAGPPVLEALKVYRLSWPDLPPESSNLSLDKNIF